MTKELDDYLMKCVLESLELHENPEEVAELCACSLGLKNNNEKDGD